MAVNLRTHGRYVFIYGMPSTSEPPYPWSRLHHCVVMHSHGLLIKQLQDAAMVRRLVDLATPLLRDGYGGRKQLTAGVLHIMLALVDWMDEDVLHTTSTCAAAVIHDVDLCVHASPVFTAVEQEQVGILRAVAVAFALASSKPCGSTYWIVLMQVMRTRWSISRRTWCAAAVGSWIIIGVEKCN